MPSADAPEAQQVRIIEQKEATITEYRANGKLYKIKVQPRVGPAYYLIDKEGKGQMVREDSLPNLAVPMWVLFEVGLLACGMLKQPEQGKEIVAG